MGKRKLVGNLCVNMSFWEGVHRLNHSLTAYSIQSHQWPGPGCGVTTTRPRVSQMQGNPTNDSKIYLTCDVTSWTSLIARDTNVSHLGFYEPYHITCLQCGMSRGEGEAVYLRENCPPVLHLFHHHPLHLKALAFSNPQPALNVWQLQDREEVGQLLSVPQ